ncbi:MAG: thiamine-phosphate kinase [Euryarchaeota archaeon]|nr:thiamine-phosphate kinase [Euryarchaeota archaeon]MDE1837024.1 thiamine-phosphate kinase [Euryarchaeota archaeon]MDE1879874.1 thiamine-phosphate kinase [Euryarchaeota archaeon]MDE2045682.1 thiamine-phosphate kinase [Thermoplasmata archaeon]
MLKRPRKVGSPRSPPSGTLEEVTEAGLHEWIAKTLPAGRMGLLPLGDDCAAIPTGGRNVHLLTTDAVMEETHFPATADPRAVGRFAANVNFSDLAAKGGRPVALLGALLLPPDTPARWAQQVILGLEEASRLVGTHLLGGDSKRSERRGIVPIAVGEANANNLMPISGAFPGDLIATTGTTGRGSSAYLAWKEGSLTEKDAMGVVLGVRPRLREGLALAPTATATTDTSDGLLAAARHLCEASGVSVHLREDWVPYDPLAVKVAKALRLPVEEVSFLGGDYELLTCFPRSSFDATLKNVVRAGGRVCVIGSVHEKGPSFFEDKEGNTRPFPKVGWDSFARS